MGARAETRKTREVVKSGVTLRELAKMLNVSASTVSKSLSDSPEIGTETKTKVLRLARDMGYRPNYLASRLKNGRSMAIGVILPTVMNPFYANLLTGIEEVLQRKGYKLLVFFTKDKTKDEIESIEHVLDGSVEGVLVCMARETQCSGKNQHLRHSRLKNLPKVLVDRIDAALDMDQVGTDDFKVSFKASSRLIEKHAVQNLLFASLMGGVGIEHMRYEGYRSAMIKYGMEESIGSVRTTDRGVFRKEMQHILDRGQADGFLCANASTMKLVLEILRNDYKNLKCALPVIGFGEASIKKISDYPNLYTIDQGPKKMGELAASLLCQRIASGLPSEYQIRKLKAKIS